MTTEIRQCLSCERPVKGRTDKKFCDDYCRNHYNNQQKLKSEGNGYVKIINGMLLKNRKILAGLLGSTSLTIEVSREKLLLLGYSFGYSTHTQIDEHGHRVYWCYEFGCARTRPGWFLVVRKSVE